MSVQVEISIILCIEEEDKKNLVDYIWNLEKRIIKLKSEIQIIKWHKFEFVDVEKLEKELNKYKNELIESIKSLIDVKTIRDINIIYSSPCTSAKIW